MSKLLLSIVLICLCTSIINAQEKKPFDLEIYFNRKLTDQDRVKIKENIYQYSQQIKSHPNNAGLFVNRGVQYAFLGLYPDAISDYNKAIKLDSTIAEAYYNRGIVQSRFAYTKRGCIDIKKAYHLGLTQAKTLYNNKCGLYKSELGECP